MGYSRPGTLRQHDARLLQGGCRRLHRVRRDAVADLRGGAEVEGRPGQQSATARGKLRTLRTSSKQVRHVQRRHRKQPSCHE